MEPERLPTSVFTRLTPENRRAVIQLSLMRAYIPPCSGIQNQVRGTMHVGNPVEGSGTTHDWFSYTDEEGTQWIHPPGAYKGRTGEVDDAFLYELNPTTDYVALLEKHQKVVRDEIAEYCK